MGWPGLYGYQGYQGQGQYGAAAAGARGGYNRQGPDRSSEYFVNDEVVGAGRERQAPPAAHAGSQHQAALHGMQPWAGVPPSAHAAYAGFPPGFGFGGYGAYGGWEGYSQVAQAYGQMMEKSGLVEKKEDRRNSGEQKSSNSGEQKESSKQLFSSSSSSAAREKSPEAKPEPVMRNEREEREVEHEHPEEHPEHRFETKSSPEVKSEDRDIKTPTDMKYDLLFPPRSAAPGPESSRKQEPPSSPTTSTHSTEMVSPTSRRKQASPQKKLSPPDAPGGATVLITHAGRQLSPDREDSPPMKSSPGKPEMDQQSPAKSEYDQNSQRSPAKSTTSNMSEDAGTRSHQHSPERARLEIHHLIEKEDFSSSSEVSEPAQESAPQRRKSKAEMKEYVQQPREGTSGSPTKAFKKVEEDLEAMFSEKASNIKAAEVDKAEQDDAKDESNIESSDQPDKEMETNKSDFQKVEDDLEAMFGGLEEEKEKAAEKSPDPERKKRGRKPKAAKAAKAEQEDEDAKVEQVNPVNSGRATSKRKSAQNAEMRMKDDMDDILDQIINRKKPKKISSSSAQTSIDEAPPEGHETTSEAHQSSSKVETKEAKPEKLIKTKSKEETTSGQPDFVPKYKKTELTSSKDETKNSDTDNIFDFQDSEDDSSVSRQKPRDKKVKKVDTFEGTLSNKQPKERSSKIKLKQGRHGKIATEVSPEKPAELKFTKPYEKKVTEDLSKDKTTKEALDVKGNQTSEKSKTESPEEKVKSLAERRSRRSKGEVKEDSLETSSPPPAKDSTQPGLILDTRRSGGRRASTDSILVKEDEIEARRSRQRKWEDLDKGLDKGLAKPPEKEAASLTPKGKSSKSAESIMLEGSEEIKRIFDESLKNKDLKAEDEKQVDANESQSKETPVSPKVRGRVGRRGKASEPQSDPVEESKPELNQEVGIRSSRRSKGADVVAAAEANVEAPTELAESTGRTSRRNKVAEAAVEASQEAETGPEAGGGRPSRRSRGQDSTPALESDSPVAGKATGKGSDANVKTAAAPATAADADEKVEEQVTSVAAEPDDSSLSKADGSKPLSKKLEIKINKLDLQEAKSSEGSKVDLGGLMSRYPGLLLAASKDTKEKEKEALGSPTEPEGRRTRRNRRSSDMSASNKDEIAGGSQDLEAVSGRGRKRKVSSELPSQLHLPGVPAGIEVVRIEDSTPTPEKVASDAPTAGTRRRSRRGSDGINEDPVIQMEVEDSILTDGPESVADTSNIDSANVSHDTKLPPTMFSTLDVFHMWLNNLFR